MSRISYYLLFAITCLVVAGESVQAAGPDLDQKDALPGIASNADRVESSAHRSVSNYEELVKVAADVAKSTYIPSPDLPEVLRGLDYDRYRMMAFRYDQALWWNTEHPFWFEFFHRGFVHRDRVDINLILNRGDSTDRSASRPFPFDSDLFEYRGPLEGMKVPVDTGYAGLKVVGEFPGNPTGQEMLTFLGASYFRSRCGVTGYGTSARGLALNAASEGSEEFPIFKEFWICEPKAGESTQTILALLDSESVAGAYEFTLHPGMFDSTVHVRSTLYFRSVGAKIGIAPLSSMWMWGDGLEGPPLDPRPSVHDADGLQIHDGERWIWRALSRQSYPSLSRIPVESLQGFGLMQRERAWSRYRDNEARYDRRPSIWVEPDSSWLGGAIELFEMPAVHEGHDNIAAFWVPPEKPQPLEAVQFNYTLHFLGGAFPQSQSGMAKVRGTNLLRSADGVLNFQIVFAKSLREELESTLPELSLTTIRGKVFKEEVVDLGPDAWRVELAVQPESEKAPVELTAFLQRSGTKLSESWSYLAAPIAPPYQYPQVYTRRDE